jgi:hypothetical protein
MVRILRPEKVKTNVVTKNGECKIELTLNININTDGVSVNTGGKKDKKKKYIEEVEDKVNWAIPEFDSKKIEFGKE